MQLRFLYFSVGSKNLFPSKTENLLLTVSLEISSCKIKQFILHVQDKRNIFIILPLPPFQIIEKTISFMWKEEL